MSRFNTVPVIVQQMVETLRAKSTPENVKFNQALVVETIRDYCDNALKDWNKEQQKAQMKRKSR
jgi:hypothetical protein